MLGFSGHVFGPDPHDLPLGILAGIPYENAMFEQWRFGMGPVAYEILIFMGKPWENLWKCLLNIHEIPYYVLVGGLEWNMAGL